MASQRLDPSVTPRPPPNITFITSLLPIVQQNDKELACRYGTDFDLSVLLMVLSLMYVVFGFVYTIFGYRCFKATMFMTGFTFGTAIVYAICIQDALLPHLGNIAVSVIGGVLFGLITMFIQFVGLFVNGLHTGMLLAVGGLAVYDHLLTEHPTTHWMVVTTMTCSGIFFAVCNLYWKKGMTIFGTSLYGGFLIAISVDYYYERLEMLKWLWERVKLEAVVAPPCPFTWLYLAIWPISAIVGLITQWLFTGTGIRHEKSLSVQKRRLMQHRLGRPMTREQRAEMRGEKFRYLYQVRSAHGDVISRSFVQAIQNNGLSTGSNWNGFAVGETSTLQSDSTHLTVLPGSDHHHDSDDEMNQIQVAP